MGVGIMRSRLWIVNLVKIVRLAIQIVKYNMILTKKNTYHDSEPGVGVNHAIPCAHCMI